MRFLELDPRARFARARLAAGAFAGAVGGLAFGIVMTAELMPGGPQADGMSGLVGRALGTDNMLWVWWVNLALAAVWGLLFSVAVSPRRPGRVVGLAIGWALVLWAAGSFFALRTLLNVPLVVDRAALFDLAGHLLFGVVLGGAYVAFFHQEDALVHDRRIRPAQRT